MCVKFKNSQSNTVAKQYWNEWEKRVSEKREKYLHHVHISEAEIKLITYLLIYYYITILLYYILLHYINTLPMQRQSR